ncbi:aminoacyl-tRNA hydrolase [filamentous cyanobacterium LEGE 11480]|uniref:Peptidyl-tRNA hydrolase n=1 Tax=Romeriopsis navalis LEGE 11480 TaxID=2777977 RepID=A0A928VSB2_9CYAN|nr:aminoacyl-tRNA hydrolase [Romeriopsis navalis]MBE9031642.1 aminoacyl-tRNA hydrolase [Romeriopsis navalis LEGE 11480]
MPASKPPSALIQPQLIVGLGNPGAKYDGTRHNIGFVVLDALARAWNIPMSENKKFQGWFGEGLVAGQHKVRLLKPTTYMNNSGQAIRAVLDWYKIPPEAVLVVYDDMDLPVGRLRLRLTGSAGGQNGMKSAIAHLGTQKFPRLRIGIGSKAGGRDAVSHVLGSFAPADKAIIVDVLDLAVGAVETALKQGVEKSMNLYNNRVIAPESLE